MNYVNRNRKYQIPFTLSAVALAVSVSISGAAYADSFTIQGTSLDFVPGDDAKVYALECTGCSDPSNIKAFPTKEHETNFDENTAISFMWIHNNDDGDSGILGADDFGIGGSFSNYESSTNSFVASDSGRTIGTPYGTLDSSSAGVSGNNKDDAMFATGDLELGWNRHHGNADVRLFAGLRTEYMEYEREAVQDLSSSHTYNGRETSEFFGAGPRVGASIKKPVGSSKNFAVIAGLSGGVMYGKLERDFKLTSDTDHRDGYENLSENVWVPFADAEAGFAFQVEEGISLEVGYQAGLQRNILQLSQVCTDDYADDVKPFNSSCEDKKSNVITHGAFLRVTAEF